MKRIVKLTAILLALLMLVGILSACTASEPVSPAPEYTDEPSDTEAAPTEEPAVSTAEPTAEPTEEPISDEELIGSLLPDWEPVRTAGMRYSYEEISENDYNDYIRRLKSEGFGCIDRYPGIKSGILYRDDIWIDYNASLPDYVTLAFAPRKGEGGYSACDVMEFVGDGLTERQPAAAIESTPEGFYENTGLQIFRVLYDCRPDGYLNAGMYKIQHFITGGGEAVLLEDYMDAGFGDLNGDGEYEIVTWHSSDSSVGFYINNRVFKNVDGAPVRISRGVTEVDWGEFKLISKEGKLYYSFTPYIRYDSEAGTVICGEENEYEIVLLDDGRLVVSDPNVKFDPGPGAFTDMPELYWFVNEAWPLASEVMKHHTVVFTKGESAVNIRPEYVEVRFSDIERHSGLNVYFYKNEAGEWEASIDTCRLAMRWVEEDEPKQDKWDADFDALLLDGLTLNVTAAQLESAGYAFANEAEEADCAAKYMAQYVADMFTGSDAGNYFHCREAQIVECVPDDTAQGLYTHFARIAVRPTQDWYFIPAYESIIGALYGGEEYPDCSCWITIGIGINAARTGDGAYALSLSLGD